MGIRVPNGPSKKTGKWWYNLSFVYKDRQYVGGTVGAVFMVDKEFYDSVCQDIGGDLKPGEIYNIEINGRYLNDISVID